MIIRILPMPLDFNSFQFIQEVRDAPLPLDLLTRVSYHQDTLYFNIEDTPESQQIITDALVTHVPDWGFDFNALRLEEVSHAVP